MDGITITKIAKGHFVVSNDIDTVFVRKKNGFYIISTRPTLSIAGVELAFLYAFEDLNGKEWAEDA